MIRLENISKKFLDFYVLKNISLKFELGKITGIIGPNGAGKSTLLKIVSGFLLPESGFIFLNDKKVKDFENLKYILSYMPEMMQLYPDYYVSEFLRYYHRVLNFKDEELFNSLGLKSILNKKIKVLSKGWHQRLKLYIALCTQKPVIVLDEPFEGFDPLQMNEIIKVIKMYQEKGKTFVISIHQLTYAQKICDYIVILNEGRIVSQGLLADLYKRFSTKELEQIFIRALQK